MNNSVLQSTKGVDVAHSANNSASDPLFSSPWDIGISITPLRTSVRFRPSAVVSLGANSLPANVIGDYTVKSGSQASGRGAVSFPVPSYQQFIGSVGANYAAPFTDVTGAARNLSSITSGAWQISAAAPPIIIPAALIVPDSPCACVPKAVSVL